MKKSQRLEPILDISKMKEKDAAKVMVDYRQQLQINENKLLELMNYREEYMKKYNEAGRTGINVNKVNEFRHFIYKLDEAIKHQQGIVSQSRKEYEHKLGLWKSRLSKHKAVEKVAERYRSDELHIEKKREQYESDERSQNMRVKPEK